MTIAKRCQVMSSSKIPLIRDRGAKKGDINGSGAIDQ
jgi:hypothetical protein